MKLVVGLGNPGRKYAGTRHNIGFDVVDEIAARHGLDWEGAPADALIARWRLSTGLRAGAAGVLLVKPTTFMNLSGHATRDLLHYFKVDLADLLVIVDEAQLDLGRLRTRANGSAGGHNGLKSLIEQLGTDQFARMRIGVGRGDARRDLADHVLAKFDGDERPLVRDTIAKAADAVELFVSDGLEVMMNRFNRKEEKEKEDKDNGRGTTENGS
jgi:PTH1 family peptidyl-tRNA hydrolase